MYTHIRNNYMFCCKPTSISISTPKTGGSVVDHWVVGGKPVMRAGTIILDYRQKKVLIIQSYGKLWGLPKGHLENDENPKVCAIRETLEETGIKLEEYQLRRIKSLYNGTAIYYFVNGTGLVYNQDKIHNTEEITGISWMCIDCIYNYVQNKTMNINSHLRYLLPFIAKEFQ